MQTRHEYRGLTWVDLESPNPLEARQLAEEFGILPHIAEELTMTGSKQRAESYSGHVFVAMHFPAVKHSHRGRQQEINFVIGRNFLITAHYDTIDPLHKFAKVFDTHAALATEPLGDHAGYLFFYAVRKLYQSVEHELETLQSDLSNIEEHIFSGDEVRMVLGISHASRALLNLRQTIEPHREILSGLEENGVAFFGDDFRPFLRALTREYYRVHNHVMRATDSLHELRETNNSLLTTKQNETLKVYTVMAFFTFPLALITAVLSIHSSYNPILGAPYDFWIIVGLLVFALCLMYAYFRHKKWL